MLIECKIKRDGPTTVSRSGPPYVFTERPELTNGDMKAKVCVIPDPVMQAQLIASTLYREYVPKDKKTTSKPKQETEGTPPVDPLDFEHFFTLVNVAQVKKAIRDCCDVELLDKIGSTEHIATERRQWVIDALNERIGQLAQGNPETPQ
jgi:hypothetical protein